jgi:hypothetical protein
MGSRIRQVFQVLKEPENLIVIVGVIVAVVLAYSGIRNNNTQQALTAILAVVGALAVAQIISGHGAFRRDRQIEGISSLLQNAGLSANPPLRLRTDVPPPLPNSARNAKDILIIGRTLVFVLYNTEFFKERLRDGATIRLAMVDPNNGIVCKAMAPCLEISEEGFVAAVWNAMELIKRISEAAQRPDQIELRFIDFVPTLGLLAIDSHSPSGQIIVEMLPHKIEPYMRPQLLFKASENHSWFLYFRDICEATWRDATPYKSN